MIGPGKPPPNSSAEIQVPTSGMASTIPSTMRSPVPDSRSSGSA